MRVLDLFSGIGGFSLGLERAGMRTVAFCEIEPYCRAVLASHWPDVPCAEDITKREFKEGEADVVCGGFPCQDISQAGAGAGLAGERSGLWRELLRAIRMVRPPYAIVENVAALLGRGLGSVLGDLAEIGYDTEWNCISASAIGAPHRRDRIWIVAYPRRERSERRREARDDQPRLQGWLSEFLRERSGECTARTSSASISDAEREGQLQSQGRVGEEWRRPSDGRWWFAEPAVGRVANGIPSRVDRLKGLGNAVVPQIPEIIGRAIMFAERNEL